MIYADYNASSPMRESVKAAMIEAFEYSANPSSVHKMGRIARKALEDARANIANYLGINSKTIVFTSGATESAQIAFDSAIDMGITHYFILATEHDCIIKFAQNNCENLNIIPVNQLGVIDLEALENAIALKKVEMGTNFLVAVQAANNETGILQPISKVSGIVKNNGGLLLIDATQALGRINPDKFMGYGDLTIISSHKIGGPMGVGALILSAGIDGATKRAGGGQENGVRSGTQNMPAIVGFGAAIKDLNENEITKIQEIRDYFEDNLKEEFPAIIIGEYSARQNNTSNFFIDGWTSEHLLIALDLEGVCISAGSACSSGSMKTSRVLKAMNINDAQAKCAVRVSFGYKSTVEDAQNIINALKIAYKRKFNIAA